MRGVPLPAAPKRFRLLAPALVIILAACSAPAEPGPTSDNPARPAMAQPPAGHAHNDYEHARPLLDALSHGFVSVEADVHLRDGELFVAHTGREIVPGRTLQSLYLEPLAARIRANGGSVHGDGRPLLLLVDVKTGAADTYLALHQLLQRYEDMLTVYRGQEIRPGPVVVLVSGRRARGLVQQQALRYAAFDGRLSDLGSGAPASLAPLVSARWGRHFAWRGDGPMPPRERMRLDRLVGDAHAAGRLVRFWATPDEPGARRDTVWWTLVDAGVDLISTDDLAGLARFLDGIRAGRN